MAIGSGNSAIEMQSSREITHIKNISDRTLSKASASPSSLFKKINFDLNVSFRGPHIAFSNNTIEENAKSQTSLSTEMPKYLAERDIMRILMPIFKILNKNKRADFLFKESFFFKCTPQVKINNRLINLIPIGIET